MTSHRFLVALGVFVLFGPAARADEILRFPGEVPVDLYHSGGPIGSLTDGEWVAVPFWRPLESVPLDFNLLDPFDPEAVDRPLTVEGFVRVRDGLPPSWEARGTGAVPFVFVRRTEFRAAIADGELTLVELALLPSLRVGTATFYQEQNHLYGIHPVSHYAMAARGTLDDGRSFDLLFVEVDLELLRTEIVFK